MGIVAFGLLCAGILRWTPVVIPDDPLTPKLIQRVLVEQSSREAARGFAERIRKWAGAENLKKGTSPRTEGLTAVWALETQATRPPMVLSEDGTFRKAMTRLGETPVYLLAETFAEGAAMLWKYEIDGKSTGGGRFEIYSAPPESVRQSGVPEGRLTHMPTWRSKVFDGTEREWWVYVPTQYKPENPACVMIFQDGGGSKDYVSVVFDNLIARGEMPVTVGIFVNPGKFADGRSNRSFEYDTLSDQYARFLLEEILPEVEKQTHLRHDAASRAIAGSSSGGICAFTAAWERPEQFSKVLSWVGSFTNIASGKTLREGGHNYPALIRKTPKKPIRVFLQDGENDLDNQHGNWPLANQQMAKSLAFAGYDYKFVYGHGFHSAAHGRAILPDSLRWLWKDDRAR